MATTTENTTHKLDGLKWLLVFLVLVGGIVANYYFAHVALAIRASAGIVIACVAIGLASMTAKGQIAWEFIKAARNELRKVVWPTRPETIQTTAMVVVMVLITAVVLWGFDTLFMWLISILAGHRG